MSTSGVKSQLAGELARSHHYTARQPVLTAEEKIVGYELLFRNGPENFFSSADSDAASRSSLDTAILMGLELLCDGVQAFVNCTRELLVKDYITLLPYRGAVVEVLRTVPPDELVIAACQRAKAAGCMVALDDFTVDDPRQPLVAVADILKVDMRRTSPGQAAALIQRYAKPGRNLLAMKVETAEEFAAAKEIGFTLFQGFFFRKPEIMRARKLPVRPTSCASVLQIVAQPVMDVAHLENTVKGDPGLCFRLLRYLSSSPLGTSSGIGSLQEAFSLIGDLGLRQWIWLTATLAISSDKPSDMVLSAMSRARFCELIGRRLNHSNADFFLVGLLSRMDDILEVPMGVVLGDLAISKEIKALLLRQAGQVSLLCELMAAQEQADQATVALCAAKLNLPEEVVADFHSQALEWAQQKSAKA